MANMREITCPNCGCKFEVDMDTFDPQKYDCPLCGCLYSWSLKKQNEEKIESNEHFFAQRSIYQSRRIKHKTKNVRLGFVMGFELVGSDPIG